MKTILSLFLALLLLSGCKTKEVIRYVPITNTVTKIDSFTILKTDSFREFTKGDTIYKERWRTLYKSRVQIKHDTLTKVIEVAKPYSVEKEVIKYKRDWIWYMGLFFVLGAGLFCIYAIFK